MMREERDDETSTIKPDILIQIAQQRDKNNLSHLSPSQFSVSLTIARWFGYDENRGVITGPLLASPSAHLLASHTHWLARLTRSLTLLTRLPAPHCLL